MYSSITSSRLFVVGFRIDAAKHIQPDDIVLILTKLRNNLGGEMPEDWMTYLEILLGGESDLLMCNPDSGIYYATCAPTW